ncbi:MAG: protein-disulfide reductase DsbD domain-containing protein, partial [Chlorobium sp.]
MLLLFLLIPVQSVFSAGFLDPEDAFRLKAEYTGSRSLVLDWEIAEGYKLSGDQVKVNLKSGRADLGVPVLPAGERVKDPS